MFSKCGPFLDYDHSIGLPSTHSRGPRAERGRKQRWTGSGWLRAKVCVCSCANICMCVFAQQAKHTQPRQETTWLCHWLAGSREEDKWLKTKLAALLRGNAEWTQRENQVLTCATVSLTKQENKQCMWLVFYPECLKFRRVHFFISSIGFGRWSRKSMGKGTHF